MYFSKDRPEYRKTLELTPPYLLTLIFVTLKLCKVIDWVWFWVLSPMVIYFTLYVIVALIIIIVRTRNDEG